MYTINIHNVTLCCIFQSMDGCIMVFYRLYTEIVPGFLFCLARCTSHCVQPPDDVSFLFGSGNNWLLNLIGRTLVSATCLLSAGCLWPSSRLATKERLKSN